MEEVREPAPGKTSGKDSEAGTGLAGLMHRDRAGSQRVGRKFSESGWSQPMHLVEHMVLLGLGREVFRRFARRSF